MKYGTQNPYTGTTHWDGMGWGGQGLIMFTLLVTVKKAMRNSVFVYECYSQAKKDSKQTNKLYVTVIRAMTNSGVGQV